ncbi:MAG TPA: hypothetical protein VNZ61_20795 [Roseomonas sp.]|nr:hypothetical protein [Roseomonas sp.]
MSEVILVVLHRPETAPRLLAAAARLAELAGGAHAIRAALDPAALLNDASMPEAMVDELRAAERDRVATLKATFERWTTEVPDAFLSSEWCAAEGQPDGPVEAHGRRADFLVTARSLPGDDWPVRQAFKTALLRTERPVLVVPPAPASADGFGRQGGRCLAR